MGGEVAYRNVYCMEYSNSNFTANTEWEEEVGAFGCLLELY